MKRTKEQLSQEIQKVTGQWWSMVKEAGDFPPHLAQQKEDRWKEIERLASVIGFLKEQYARAAA